MNASAGLAMVITTVSSAQEAESLASVLVGQSLAACVQIDGPVTSHYRWAGRVEKASEFRLTIKTSQQAWPALHEKLLNLHSYEEPEIIMFAVHDASDGYRAWVLDQTSS
jgi:periplasmic divalent cation tolerance protein